MTIGFNFDPYYDDFTVAGGAKDENYMRVLFKPGFAVQARELTQLQSIIQNQLKLFGDHIFQDGSPVIGGHLSLDTSVTSIKLQNIFETEDVFVSDFLGRVIVNDTGSKRKRAFVTAVDDSQINRTLMVRYLRGEQFDDDEIIRVINDPSKKARLAIIDSGGVGSTVSINEGIFYVDGFFVRVPEQTIVLDAYSRTPTYRIGLEIDETVIDSSQDSSLLDPAQGSFNYQAPGADRYQFSLNLTKRTLDSIDDSKFFELLRVENGVITKQVKYPIYSEIEKTFARRTFDESGNYTVTPFRASAIANTSDDLFDVVIEPGKAYIRGYEFENIAVNKIAVNKARTTEEVRGYDLSLEYGNYVTVKNLFSGNSGIFRTDQYAELELHVVPSANINTSSSSAYNATRVGSTLVRNLQRAGDNTYNLYIVDQKAESNTFNPTAQTSTTITLPSIYSAADNAYANVAISIKSGPGAGQSRRIISYNESSKVATVDRAFDPVPNTSSVLSLNYSFGDTKSIVVRPTTFSANVYGTKDPANAIFPSMDVDASSQSIAGVTFSQRTNFNKLIYTLPEFFIDKESFNDVDYYHRKLVLDESFVSGNTEVVLAGAEKIYYGTNGQLISPFQANTNFLVIVKNKGTSSFANGQVVNLTATNAGVLRNTDQNIVIRSGDGGDFTADVFINVKVEDSESSALKTKTVKGNLNFTELSVGDSPDSGTVTVGGTGVKIHADNGLVWYTNPSEVVKTPGEKQSLYIGDVVRINKIYDSGNASFAPNTTNAIDITNRYLLDIGQRDNYYDHASIILKDGQNPPVGQTAVSLVYFDQGSINGYSTGKTYTDVAYENDLVPVYASSTVSPVFLGDAVDFRPKRTNFTTARVFTGLKIPYTELSMELNYAYYVPRIDKLVATQNREFKVIPGIPSKYPQPPEDDPLSMTLYTIYIPPFTKDVKDVKFKYQDNRRYTMRDIGKLERRIERIEYYTQLSLLEQEARNETFLYEDRVTEKEKYGILVDQFDGFNVADNKNTDLLCNISFNELKPYKNITQLNLNFASASGGYFKNSRTYSLPYTETTAIEQRTATKAISVQPYLFGTFQGQIQLRPEIDNWVSTSLPPEVVTNEPISNQRPPTEISITPAATPEPAPIVPSLVVPPATIPQIVAPNLNLFPFIANTMGFETPLFNINTSNISPIVNLIPTTSVAPSPLLSGFNFESFNLDRFFTGGIFPF